MEEKEPKKKFSFFEITAVVLIVLLVVGIFVEIIVIVNMKNEIATLQKELDSLPQPPEEEIPESVSNLYLKNIEHQLK